MPVFSRDNLKLILFFIMAAAVVYAFPRIGLPQFYIQVFFLTLIILAFVSKDDVFWLVFYLVLLDPPGRLFTGASPLLYRLPIYTLLPQASLGFTELFLFAYVAKSLLRRRRTGFIFGNHAKALLIYGAVVLAYSFIIGMGAANVVAAIRHITPWLWLLILPNFISDTEQLDRAFQLIFPFVFIAFASQIYTQTSGVYLHSLISGESSRLLGDAEEQLIRASNSAHLIFLSLAQSLFYLARDSKRFNPNYLNSIIALSVVALFMTGTRGWIIALVLLLASVFFMGGFNFFKQALRFVVILGLLFILAQSLYPGLFFQINQSLARVLTLEQLAEGDLTAGGTLSRLTDRGPRVMAVFAESRVIGWGVSGKFYAYSDGHVGNQNLLMQGGIIGFLVWILGLLAVLAKTLRVARNQAIRNDYGNGLLVFAFALFATFFIHSTSMQMLGFAEFRHTTHIHWAFILCGISVYYNAAVAKAGLVPNKQPDA